ncbi:uncharacterized protein LOC115091766 [Rhinatrema bivittatum]|uniref:uncharacterized protein LOC115091766 n=1 Tax=Rhinatrema bivittatum TaxID=194408 RepID=UPI00112E939A|nr:uncharacterized protein LOC115091766 [Rhinatrema bivittatum]
MIQRCTHKWPGFCVNWPPTGTFNFQTATRVHKIVIREGNPGCPEDIPYITAWIAVIENPPSWAKKLVDGAALVMVTQACKMGDRKSPNRKRKGKAAILDSTEHASAEAAIFVVQGNPRTPEKKIKPLPPPALPDAENILPPPSPPVPSNAQADPRMALAHEERPGTATAKEEGGGEASVSDGTRSKTQAAASLQLPIRETSTVVPIVPTEENEHRTTQTIRLFTYIPFTSSDLFNWKQLGPSYAEKPEQMIDFLRGIFAAHNPNWADIRHLASILFTTEERRQIQLNMEEAARLGAGSDGRPEDAVRDLAPTADPNWDFQTAAGRERITAYQTAFLEALKKGKQKVVNMGKIQDVVQQRDESPGNFLERLMDAYRQYSPFDPEDPRYQSIILMSFVSQSCPDIRRKLQKQEGFEGMNISQLKVMADKVYVNREPDGDNKEKKETRKLRERVSLLAAALEETNFGNPSRQYHGYPGFRGRGRPPSRGLPRGRANRGGLVRGGRVPLGTNQCAYCKQEGHWKSECPVPLQAKQEEYAPPKSKGTEWQMTIGETSGEDSET